MEMIKVSTTPTFRECCICHRQQRGIFSLDPFFLPVYYSSFSFSVHIMLICKSQTIKYILLTAALYGPCVLANRGSGKQQLDTYDDTTTSISSSSSLASESLQSMSMPHSSSMDEALAEESAHADSVNERIGITIPDDNKNNTVEEDEKHHHHQQKQQHEEEQEAPMEEMQEPTQPEDDTQGDIIENSSKHSHHHPPCTM